MDTDTGNGLIWLEHELLAHGGLIDEATARRLLARADLSPADVAPYVEESDDSYSRRCVVRGEHFELLVLTWRPGQASVAHDHSGSLCGLKVVQGRMTEQLFDSAADGHVRATGATQIEVGETSVDPGIVVHAIGNASDSEELLVTVHVYSPPLPEIRRYAVSDTTTQPVFSRRPATSTRRVAIIGGGFTGTMTFAHVLKNASESHQPLHLTLIDRQPAFGEGVAYRTNDAKHLLNVPAGRMSAWPDRPDDFLDFARREDPAVGPHTFCPRRIYGRYLRQIVHALAAAAGDHVSAEIVRDEAECLTPADGGGWSIVTADGRNIAADAAVLTVGHRPPDDVFADRWTGPRQRFVSDPWAALVLSQIRPDEPVILIGSGLTAMDALLTLARPGRTAPLTLVSRRGLIPQPHAAHHCPPADVDALLADWLVPDGTLSTRGLVNGFRQRVADASQGGDDWRQVIDGLRPSIPRLWQRLSVRERSRFLRHVRPFWEIHRHRMAPAVTQKIERLRAEGVIQVVAGTLLNAQADEAGVDVMLARRGRGMSPEPHRVAWVINCTGPGVHTRHTTHPVLRPLLADGVLQTDPLDLGLQTDGVGRAVDAVGRPHATLFIAGTLRKSTLWESTAVPELRQQAQAVARHVLDSCIASGSNLC